MTFALLWIKEFSPAAIFALVAVAFLTANIGGTWAAGSYG